MYDRKIHSVACGWAHSCAILTGDISEIIHHQRPTIITNETDYKYLTLGDLDGFFGMLVQCVIQLMIIFQTMPIKCGFLPHDITTVLIPSIAWTLFVGHLFFSIQGIRMSRRESRIDVTAQPHGINTVLLFAYMLLVMAPEYELTGDSGKAHEVGIFACLLTGALQMLLLPFVGLMKKYIPRAALLSSTSGIALTFLSMGFAFEVWANPIIAICPLMLVVSVE